MAAKTYDHGYFSRSINTMRSEAEDYRPDTEIIQPLLSGWALLRMNHYLKRRGDGDSGLVFMNQFGWIVQVIEHVLIKYGANYLPPAILMPLIDTIHNCKAEMDHLPEYNSSVFDVAYRTAYYVVEAAKESDQSEIVKDGGSIDITLPQPGIEVHMRHKERGSSPSLSPRLKTFNTYVSPVDEPRYPGPVSSKNYQSGWEFRLPDVDKSDLEVIKSLWTSESPLSSATTIDAESEDTSQYASETSDDQDDFAEVIDHSLPLPTHEEGLNSLRKAINGSPSKPKLARMNVLVDKQTGRVIGGPNHNTIPSSSKRPGPAMRIMEKAIEDAVAQEGSSKQNVEVAANKEDIQVKSTPPKKAISNDTTAMGYPRQEPAVNPESYNPYAAPSNLPGTSQPVPTTVPKPTSSQVKVCHKRLANMAEAVRQRIARRKSNAQEKKLIADCRTPKPTTKPYQATVCSGSDDEYSPVIGNSKRKMSDGSQPYEPAPSTTKKALRITTKRPKNSSPERIVPLCDRLDEDDEDPSFVSEAAKTACKRLRCKVDKCDGGCGEKNGVGEKRITRAMSKTMEAAKDQGKKKADAKANKGKRQKRLG